jgi:hypothetical protein
MLKRTLVLLTVVCTASYAAETPPNEESVRKLLEVSQIHKVLDAVMGQMDGYMKQAIAQVTQGQSLSPQMKKNIERRQAEMVSIFKEMLDWHKLEPMYIRVYQKTFTQSEVDNLIAMYQSPGGQALLNKMPVVLQNTMNEMQPIMQPIMQRIQRMQRDVVADIQAEKKKSG